MARKTRRRVRRVLAVLVVAVGVVSLAAGAYLTFGTPPTSAADPSPSPTVTREPTPSATPTETPTPIPTPTPTAKPAACTAAHISAPSIGLEAEVGEYTYEQAQAEGGVNPPEVSQAVWYSGYYRHDNIYSVMSTQAEDAVYVYGHAYLDLGVGAVFDHITDFKPGDVVTVSACGETVTLVVQEVFDISKSDFSQDGRVFSPEPQPGKWVFVTCNRDGPRQDGHTTQNTAVVLQVQYPEPPVEESASKKNLESRLADRLN